MAYRLSVFKKHVAPVVLEIKSMREIRASKSEPHFWDRGGVEGSLILPVDSHTNVEFLITLFGEHSSFAAAFTFTACS